MVKKLQFSKRAMAVFALSLGLLCGCTNEKAGESSQEATKVEITEAVTTQPEQTKEQMTPEQTTLAPPETTKEETIPATTKTEPTTPVPTDPEGENDMIEITCPAKYLTKKMDVDYGTTERIKYYSATCEKERPAIVVLPANYDANKKYPVLYILHGIFGDENSMYNGGNAGAPVILGNLMAMGQAKEMIQVYPFMYASKTQNQCTKIDDENTAAYDNFINDLRDDLMPYIREHYSVLEGRENTACLGFSMGGRETLAIGLSLQDRIGYICAIAPAPGLVEGTDWAMHHKGQFLEEQLKFETEPFIFMLCSGDKDSVVGKFPMSYHDIFSRNNQEHTWWIIPGSDHGDPAISSGIYNFGCVVFK